MKIKQIRNATVRIEYAGNVFLIDPWLADKGTMGCFADIPGMPFRVPDKAKEQIPMPICALPESVEDVLSGVDYYIVTHIHPDHVDMSLDGTVGAKLDKTVPVLLQSENDAEVFKKSGFQNISVLADAAMSIRNIRIAKTPAMHGVIEPCGDACGVIFQSDEEKTLYLAGDTIWYDGVKKTLREFKPDIVLLNACAAELVENGRLIMNDEDVAAVMRTAPQAKIIISHMDNVAHACITRQDMRGLLARRNITEYLMPKDGEVLAF